MTGQDQQELLRLEGIGVRLGGREILRDVSFAVRAGEFTGLIGPNGAGKTTLLKVILGLQAPTAGRVLLNGGPRPQRGGGRLIGYVPQKLSIDPDMPLRARDVVALGIDGNRLGFPLPSAARRDLVDGALRAVGAEAYADARVGELSGGEQQRVMIAHAVWAGIALSYRTNWPLGFYVGVIAAGFFLLGQAWAAVRRRAAAPRPVPPLSTVQ